MKIIPYIDIRTQGSLTEIAERYKQETISLINASRNTFGAISRAASYALLPLGDFIAQKWLEKSNNPYFTEISAFAKAINIPGIFALNLSYEWGCTCGAFQKEESVDLLRILDWPFPSLGEHLIILHQGDSQKDFYNVTWPGVSGVFQAMAPGRFAAALNQAPMRRHKTGIYVDWLRNRKLFYKQNALPPAHLLRQVFESAVDYNEAVKMLCTTPIALPVIYTLTGVKSGQGCIIERTENDYAIRDIDGTGRVVSTNHFQSHLNGYSYGWMPRAIDSAGRYINITSLTTQLADKDNFEWYVYPMANHLSRLAMKANAATGELSVMGAQGVTPVTEVFRL